MVDKTDSMENRAIYCINQANGEKTMFKTNASIRRFLMFEKRKDYGIAIPEKLWDRYEIYVYAVGSTEFPKGFKEWLGD